MNGHLALAARLNGTAGLTALVANRIYPDVMPDSPVYPAVTYQKISGASARGSTTDPPLKSAVFQVSAWSRTRLEARAVAAQVRNALDRMRKVTVGGVAVDDCFYESDVDLFDPDTRTYFVHASYKLHYRDPA